MLVLDESVGTTGSTQDEGGASNNDETHANAPAGSIGYAEIAAASLFSVSADAGSDGEAGRVYALSLPGSTSSGLSDAVTDFSKVRVLNSCPLIREAMRPFTSVRLGSFHCRLVMPGRSKKPTGQWSWATHHPFRSRDSSSTRSFLTTSVEMHRSSSASTCCSARSLPRNGEGFVRFSYWWLGHRRTSVGW